MVVPCSFRSQLVPVLISTYKDAFNIANIKLNTSNIKSAVGSIEKLWDEAYPEYVFEYQFVDEKIASFYEEEQKLSTLYKIFASLADNQCPPEGYTTGLIVSYFAFQGIDRAVTGKY